MNKYIYWINIFIFDNFLKSFYIQMELARILSKHGFIITVLDTYVHDTYFPDENIFDNEYIEDAISCLEFGLFLSNSIGTKGDIVIDTERYGNVTKYYYMGESINIGDEKFDILPNCMYMLEISMADESHFMCVITTYDKAIVLNMYGGLNYLQTVTHDINDFIFLWNSYINSSMCNKYNGAMNNIVYNLVKKITGFDELIGRNKYFISVDLTRIDNIEEKQYSILNNIKIYIEEKLYPTLKYRQEQIIVNNILKDF